MSSNPQYQYLRYSIEDSICVLLINREKYLNALSVKVIEELINFYQWADKNKNIAVIIMAIIKESVQLTVKSDIANEDIKDIIATLKD